MGYFQLPVGHQFVLVHRHHRFVKFLHFVEEIRNFEFAPILVIDLLILDHEFHFAGYTMSNFCAIQNLDAVVTQLDADGVGVVGLEEGEGVEGGLVEHVDAAQQDELGAIGQVV